MHAVRVECREAKSGRPTVGQGHVIRIVQPCSSNLNEGDVVFVVEPRDNLFEREEGEVYVFDPELSTVRKLCSNATYTIVPCPATVVIELTNPEYF